MGVKRAYYLAYPIGLIVSFVSFWICNLITRPAIMLSGWHEPKNYFRPEEDAEFMNDSSVVLEGTEVRSADDSIDGGIAKQDKGAKAEKIAMESNVDEKVL